MGGSQWITVDQWNTGRSDVWAGAVAGCQTGEVHCVSMLPCLQLSPSHAVVHLQRGACEKEPRRARHGVHHLGMAMVGILT